MTDRRGGAMLRALMLFFAMFVGGALEPARGQPSGTQGKIGLRSWGYQLNGVDPSRLSASPHDALVIDYSRNGSDDKALTPAEVERLKFKPDGSRRVVLAYLSIGEAEDYRFYWRRWWGDVWFLPNILTRPNWRAGQNRDWGGNYAVRFWEPAWQEIIVGRGGYLERILAQGFDGVWLDKVDSAMEDVAKGRPSAKADMIAFVKRIAATARTARPGFLIFPQNGEELLDDPSYRALIDGLGKEDLLYGEGHTGQRNDAASISDLVAKIRPLVAAGKPVLAVEYLADPARIDAARRELAALGYTPHFADRDLRSMRFGDYPEARVAVREKSKGRAREASTFDTWKTYVLVFAASVILILGLMRRPRSY